MKRRVGIARIIASMTSAALVAAFLIGVATPSSAAPHQSIPFTIINDSGLTDKTLYVGIFGINPSTGKDAYLKPDGTLQDVPEAANYPAPPTPLPSSVMFAGPSNGQTMTVQTPRIQSGRLYYSFSTPLDFANVQNDLGQTKIAYPSFFTNPDKNVLHGSAEYTFDNSGLWYNSTQVDFFGPPSQVGVAGPDGSIASTGKLVTNGFNQVVDTINADPAWSPLIKRNPSDEIVRVLNPSHNYGSNGFTAGNLQAYIDAVWNKYRSEDLIVKPMLEDQSIVYTGRVSGDTFNFTSPGRPTINVGKPAPTHVLGCDGTGTLEPGPQMESGWIVRTLCAGFNRSTLLEHTTQPTTEDTFFSDQMWTNKYAKVVHQAMESGHAYAFAFDDVGGYESLIHEIDPQHAYLKLDPFSGSATPIIGGDEPDEGNDDPGGNPPEEPGENPGDGPSENPGEGPGNEPGDELPSDDAPSPDVPDVGNGTNNKVILSPKGKRGKNGWFRSRVKITASPSIRATQGAVTQFKIGAGAWRTYVTPITVSKNGTTTLRSRVLSQGTVSQERLIRVKIDTKAPNRLRATTRTRSSSLVIRLSARDSVAKVARLQYKTPRGKWRNYPARGLRAKGITKIKYRAIDRAGNVSKSKWFKVRLFT